MDDYYYQCRPNPQATPTFAPTTSNRGSVSSFQLIVKEGGDNYADCDGLYIQQGPQLNGYDVYINASKSRFIGWNGFYWVLTGMYWYDEFIAVQKQDFGGFHFGSALGSVLIQLSDWPEYVVSVQSYH